MSTLAIWCRVVQSRDVSPHNFDGLAMSGLAFLVAPYARQSVVGKRIAVGHFIQHIRVAVISNITWEAR